MACTMVVTCRTLARNQWAEHGHSSHSTMIFPALKLQPCFGDSVIAQPCLASPWNHPDWPQFQYQWGIIFNRWDASKTTFYPDKSTAWKPDSNNGSILFNSCPINRSECPKVKHVNPIKSHSPNTKQSLQLYPQISDFIIFTPTKPWFRVAFLLIGWRSNHWYTLVWSMGKAILNQYRKTMENSQQSW